MKIIFDTNILVSRILYPDSRLSMVVNDAFLRHTPLLSEATFQELQDVILRPKFDAYSVVEKRLMFLQEYYALCEHVLVDRSIEVCRDAKDNKFLELALCGKADMIITGDEDLRTLHPFQGIAIITPTLLAKLPDEA